MPVDHKLYEAKTKWMEGSGPDNDVVVSSRIRLARNISGFPFPGFMSEEQANALVEKIKQSHVLSALEKEIGEFGVVDLSDINDIERQVLVEKHLVSPQHIEYPKLRSVLISDDESASIMINEEDHLRIQVFLPGLQLEEAYTLADKVDDIFEEHLGYSFSEKRGYLTSCPTNVGTGLRASVMLHLPSLVVAKQINHMVHIVSQLGLAVRGYYGEGTEASGNLFQISNQVTIGQNEDEIIKNLLAVTRQISSQEKAMREAVYRDKKTYIEDKVFRAIGTLRYAKMISSDEALNKISNIRLGLELGIVKEFSYEELNELMVLTRPAFMLKQAGGVLSSEARDVLRAEIIGQKMRQLYGE